ncbi:polyhydroxyalkanoic acid system family protein [Qipengyuania sp. DGS5-3]|uniref:polyhydroxyalkanoic acid system family protein n=1 Tax=Qipengyuania sp. DGS5-3 TaxID=3349632 RepID=UPI0036D2A4CF
MRVPITHDLSKEEVRRRLRERSHEIADHIPGNIADVNTSWADEDHMTIGVQAMGQGIDGQVIIEEGQVVFEINLPLALSFFEPAVSKAVKDKGQKLLESK